MKRIIIEKTDSIRAKRDFRVDQEALFIVYITVKLQL